MLEQMADVWGRRFHFGRPELSRRKDEFAQDAADTDSGAPSILARWYDLKSDAESKAAIVEEALNPVNCTSRR